MGGVKMKILSTLALVCVLALAAPSLEATPLPVGGSVVPQMLPDPGDVPLQMTEARPPDRFV